MVIVDGGRKDPVSTVDCNQEVANTIATSQSACLSSASLETCSLATPLLIPIIVEPCDNTSRDAISTTSTTTKTTKKITATKKTTKVPKVGRKKR